MKSSGKSFIQHTLTTLLLLFTLSCEKEDYTGVNEAPVISAYTYATNYIAFNVSSQVPFDSDQSYNLPATDSLDITISYQDTSFTLPPYGDGSYVDSNLNIPVNIDFTFSFDYNGKTVTGTTHIPSKPIITSQSATSMSIEKIEFGSGPGGDPSDQPDPLEIEWKNTDGSYYLLIIENIEEDPEPIRELDEDIDEEDIPDFSFRKQPTNASFEEIRSNEFQYYGTHRIILFHVLPDYAALYEDVSSSSQNLSNPSTNITNGYGIFTGLNSDTTYIKINKN